MRSGKRPAHTIVRAATLGGIELAELNLDPGASVAEVPAQWIEFGFIESGAIVATAGGDRRHLTSGRAFARRLNGSVTLESPTGARYLSVQIPNGWRGVRLDDLRCLHNADATMLDVNAVAALRKLFRLFRSREDRGVADRAVLEGGVIGAVGSCLLACEHHAPYSPPAWLERVEAAIADVGVPISASGLAAMAGVHRTHLQRTLRQATGFTVRQLRRQAQVNRACALIAEGRRSLADVGLASGFADQAHFSRTFKQVTGLSPMRYRAVTAGTTRDNDVSLAAVDPVGTFAFSSTTARGVPYDGTFVIQGAPNQYSGRFHTPVLPDGEIESVAVRGRTVLLTVSVPAGAAVIRLRFRGSAFTGDWRVGGYGAPLSGRRLAQTAGA